jgi:RNA 3'-terminal phosphate cyclase (ATP)
MTADWIDIDGSEGEGGGQILRSALSLSLVTGRPFRLHNVRARRRKPGLLRQHLAALQAAAAVSRADVDGATLGATRVSFQPNALRGGDYRFSVGGAGSATLVFQTVLPALLVADAPSRLVLEGGTHNPWAPPYDFVAKTWLPILARIGARVTTSLEARGYFPAGGGRFTATVEPVTSWNLLSLPTRGDIRARRARILLANLPRSIAAAEEGVLRKLLGLELWPIEHEREDDGRGPGNVILLEVETEHVHEIFSSFGEVGVRTGVVAHGCVDELRAWLATDVPVGPHLADQLLLPLAIGAGGTFRTTTPTEHTRTNADVIRRFLPDARIEVREDGNVATVTVGPGLSGDGVGRS